mgnify:CR=1 FL=1
MTTSLVMEQRKRTHPTKFTLWVAIAGMVMMFAGLTSAYIVKRSQPNWTGFEMPRVFWYSTAVILISSLTMHLALQAFRQRERKKYRLLLLLTLVLGLLFVALQWIGFQAVWHSGITFSGAGAGQFLYVIAGLHAVHVLGGVIALVVMSAKAISTVRRSYNVIPVEVMSTYWHFVDILWLYLLVFFMLLS